VARRWKLFAAVLLLLVSGLAAWVGISALSKLDDAYRDSPDVTYVLFGGFFICCAVAPLVGAVVQVRHVRRRR
jgi:hypothetical protein